MAVVAGSTFWQFNVELVFTRFRIYSEDDDDDDDDDDNAAELLATLQRIRKERAEEKERQEREAREEEEAEKEQEAMEGNPLLNIGSEKRDFSVKRR